MVFFPRKAHEQTADMSAVLDLIEKGWLPARSFAYFNNSRRGSGLACAISIPGIIWLAGEFPTEISSPLDRSPVNQYPKSA
jgi:hypothetical protein